ncbi:hypothetical protein [Sphingomonas sp. QA11]|nr:hypothetical protein [Sphingomonas sp. QA11]
MALLAVSKKGRPFRDGLSIVSRTRLGNQARKAPALEVVLA